MPFAPDLLRVPTLDSCDIPVDSPTAGGPAAVLDAAARYVGEPRPARVMAVGRFARRGRVGSVRPTRRDGVQVADESRTLRFGITVGGKRARW